MSPSQQQLIGKMHGKPAEDGEIGNRLATLTTSFL
jgi:hypothetical protein